MQERRERQQSPPLGARERLVFRALSGEFADRYVQEFLLGHIRKILGMAEADQQSVADALESPFNALLVFFGHYAFGRRGKDREEFSSLAVESLKRLVTKTPFEKVLDQSDGTSLWESFDKLCIERKRKTNEMQNRGPIQGMLELAQEIHRLDPGLSLATWVTEGVLDTGRLEPQHVRIVDIRGVGPKSASAFLRDMVWLYDVEDAIEPAERLYVHPVDRWLRLVTPEVVPEPGLGDPADWIVAGKISKYARKAGVSGARFNMGTTYFGQRVVQDPDRFSREIDQLVSQLTHQESRL